MSSLQHTKQGDFVAVRYRDQLTKREVFRTTVTLVVLRVGDFERKFCRGTGYEAGSVGYNRAYVEPWTSDHDNEQERRRDEEIMRINRCKLQHAEWYKMDYAVVQTVIKLLTDSGVFKEKGND